MPNTLRFSGKTALVTGAASGIGLATACRFAAEGADVILIDRNPDALKTAAATAATAATAAGKGRGQSLPLVCDVGNEQAVEQAVVRVVQQFGRLDVVVNNAGMMMFKPIQELTGADWLKVLQVDLLGAFFFIKQAFLHMQPGGAIVNLSSVHAEATEPQVAPYAAAKAALLSLTRSAALEGAPKGIRVNAIIPGAINTPMLWTNPEVKSGAEQVNAAEVGKPADVAAAIAFLASPDAAFIQGSSLLVDGGRLARL